MYLSIALGAVFMIGIGYVLVTPQRSYEVGNLFFGDVPKAYNVPLAQFFFERAAYPWFEAEPAPYAFHQLSRTYFVTGRFEDSIRAGLKELELYPEHTKTYYILGLTFGYMNRTDEAIGMFNKFLSSRPDSWAGRNDMAWLQFRNGDIEGALETIEPAYTAYPDNPWVLNTYGVLLARNHEPALAKQVLDKAESAAHALSADAWGAAYPGNDPAIYDSGLAAMLSSIENNRTILGDHPGVDK